MKKNVLLLFLIFFTVSSSAITLDQGWNTLSVNSEVDISDAIEEEDSCEFEQYEGEYIWKFDNGADDWTHPNILQPEDGFYLYTDNNCELEVDQSSENDIDSLEMNSGWNMIGASYSQLSEVRSSCEITSHLENGYFSFLLNGEWYHPLISGLEMDNRGYWLYLEEESCQVDFDGEIEDPNENTETVTREFELLGEPFGEEFEVDPNGNWELTGEVEREDGFIDLGRPHPGSGESFELILGTSANEFEVVRPDFSVTTDVDSNVVSVGREINVGFDDESNDRYSDIEDRSCSKRIDGEEISGSCSFKVSEEDIGNQDNAEVTIEGSLIDNTPGSGLGATDTTDLDVARPMPWEERTISLVEGESEEFSPSVSCEDQVRISYSGNSISMEGGSLSKSRGTPGEGSSISLGDFILEVENRDLNGDLEVTPRCGPEVDYVASQDGSDNLDDSDEAKDESPSDCAEDEYYDHGFDRCLEDYESGDDSDESDESQDSTDNVEREIGDHTFTLSPIPEQIDENSDVKATVSGESMEDKRVRLELDGIAGFTPNDPERYRECTGSPCSITIESDRIEGTPAEARIQLREYDPINLWETDKEARWNVN